MPRSSGKYESLEHLNSERDAVSWYWRLIALISSWMILGGYLILPNAYMKDPELRFSKGVLSILIVTIMTTGYSFTALLCFACRNWIFQAESVFLPSLTVSALGLLTVLWSFASSTRFVLNTAAIITIALASFSCILYGTLLLLTHRKIVKFRATYPVRPSPTETYYKNYLANMYPTAVHPSGDTLAPTEEDLVNQQMAMLLKKNEPAPSPEAWQSTFHLSLPEDPSHEMSAHGRRAQSDFYSNGREFAPSQQHRSTWDRVTNVFSSRGRNDGTFIVYGRGRDANRVRTGTPRALSREERRQEIEMGRV